jgi:hypothetical protein
LEQLANADIVITSIPARVMAMTRFASFGMTVCRLIVIFPAVRLVRAAAGRTTYRPAR